MNLQNMRLSKHGLSKIVAIVLIIAVVAVVVGVGILALRTYPSTTTNSTSTNSTSATSTSSSSSNSTALNSTSLLSSVNTTDYATFLPIAGLGSGVTQFEANNQHVYNYTYNGTVATFNTTVSGTVIVPPTLDEGLLLVDVSNSSTSGGVSAIDMQNGQTVWETTVPNMMMTQPLTYNGLVIIGLGTNSMQTGTSYTVRGGGTNYVAALNLTTGEVVWVFPTLGEDMPTPVIYNGLVVWGNGNGVVYALNASTGVEAWNVSLPTGSFVSMSSPALLGDSIYFGANNPYTFYCVNLTDGQISWGTPVNANGGLDDCSPVIYNGTVISQYTVEMSNGTLEPVLIGMNTTNGQILWQVYENAGSLYTGGEEATPPTLWNGVVYVDPPENGTLCAVNASNGSVLWTYNTGKTTSNANIYDGDLWILSSNGTLFVLDPTTGALLNSTDVGASELHGNLVFVGQNVIIWGGNEVISMPVSDVYSEAGN